MVWLRLYFVGVIIEPHKDAPCGLRAPTAEGTPGSVLRDVVGDAIARCDCRLQML